MSTSLNPKQLENAYSFLTHLNALDFDALGELLSPDFKHQYFPGTINPPDGKEDRGKEDWIGLLKYNFLQVFDKVTVRFSCLSLWISRRGMD